MSGPDTSSTTDPMVLKTDRYRNPDNDPRGPYLAADLTLLGDRPPCSVFVERTYSSKRPTLALHT